MIYNRTAALLWAKLRDFPPFLIFNIHFRAVYAEKMNALIEG